MNNINNILPNVVNILLGIIGFFLVTLFNKTSAQLEVINRELVSMKIELTELNAKIVDEAKVIEIVRRELRQKTGLSSSSSNMRILNTKFRPNWTQKETTI